MCVYFAFVTPQEARQRLAGGEDYWNEFKVDVNDDELAEAVVCLANGEGGALFLGVDNDGTVVGARARHGDLTDPARLTALVANKTAPAHVVAATTLEIEGKTVVAVEVPKANGVVATSGGLYVRRAVDVQGRPQCLPMQPHEAMARIASIGDRDISTIPVPTALGDSIDPLEIRRFRDLAGRQGDAVLADLGDDDLLAALGFTTVSGEPTIGALLMFGTSEALARFVPTHEVAFQVLDGLDVRVNRIERMPLAKAMVELTAAVVPYNPEEEIQEGLFRFGVQRYSEVAVREAVANALVHRNYAITGQVRLAIEDDTLTITNPGSFPEGITTANLLAAPPHARNPRLADAFKRAGLVERTGRGINRVFQGQLALGRPSPDYSRSTSSWVEVRLRAGPADVQLAAFIARSDRNDRVDLRYLQVLHEVRTERRITSSRAAELLQVSQDEARAQLNALVERGLLEARGEQKGRTYHLSASVYRELGDPTGYVRTRGFDPIQQEQMLLTYVREHGSIARRQASDLCQLSPGQASSLLRKLVKQGKLVMRGTRRVARYEIVGADGDG